MRFHLRSEITQRQQWTLGEGPCYQQHCLDYLLSSLPTVPALRGKRGSTLDQTKGHAGALGVRKASSNTFPLTPPPNPDPLLCLVSAKVREAKHEQNLGLCSQEG